LSLGCHFSLEIIFFNLPTADGFRQSGQMHIPENQIHPHDMTSPKIRRALISVSDKSGVVDFAKGLSDAGVEIYSTGGTSRHLSDAGIVVKDVADYTGFPEMMDGRVKTLHPKIFAGILCRHDLPSDMESLEKHDICSFELVVVNLYPFAETIAKPGIQESDAIEQIDIGGPSLVRAAAKNNKFTTVVTAAARLNGGRV
jgi:phosphoribosylaminoimidazolecarboxamide formyltransferase/IMP cyclohydrolase